MYLFEADTCPCGLRVQTGAIETPKFTAGENKIFPATTVEASTMILEAQEAHFSLFSHYNITLASLEY